MPIYEFRCTQCGADFEAIRPMGDTGKSLACPECGARSPEKQLSVFATGHPSQSGPCAAGETGSCAGGGRFT
jgi:putative FmdB family regulatory protein